MSSKMYPVSIPFRILSNPGFWAISSQEPFFLVLTEESWTNYYSFSPRGADFTNYIYLLACWGERPHPGFQILISQVTQDNLQLNITVKFINPQPGILYPQVLVRPLAVAEVAKNSLCLRGPLTFIFLKEEGKEMTVLKAKV